MLNLNCNESECEECAKSAMGIRINTSYKKCNAAKNVYKKVISNAELLKQNKKRQSNYLKKKTARPFGKFGKIANRTLINYC